MRTTKELLEVMLENKHELTDGLCLLVFVLNYDNIITDDERDLLDEYLHDNLENSHRFVWPKGEKKPRIKWLKEQIEKLK